MIRGCAVDSGTLTTDTEIIRMSHCGAFFFNSRYGSLDLTTRSPSLKLVHILLILSAYLMGVGDLGTF